MTRSSQHAAEIGSLREDAFKAFCRTHQQDLDLCEVDCLQCGARPRLAFLGGFDLGTLEAVGRVLQVIGEEGDELLPTTHQRILDEFGLETRGRHR